MEQEPLISECEPLCGSILNCENGTRKFRIGFQMSNGETSRVYQALDSRNVFDNYVVKVTLDCKKLSNEVKIIRKINRHS